MIWPRAGMTRNGSAYRQPPLVPPISVIESLYLPTPQAKTGEFLRQKEGNLTVYRNKETTGIRASGAKIGSSLLWCPDVIREQRRTGGVLNPEWIEQLMGFPATWTELSDE